MSGWGDVKKPMTKGSAADDGIVSGHHSRNGRYASAIVALAPKINAVSKKKISTGTGTGTGPANKHKATEQFDDVTPQPPTKRVQQILKQIMTRTTSHHLPIIVHTPLLKLYHLLLNNLNQLLLQWIQILLIHCWINQFVHHIHLHLNQLPIKMMQ
jgi:hypothetical protein